MLENQELGLIIQSEDIVIPEGLTELNLFPFLKPRILEAFNQDIQDFYFGYAPDNTADGNDELLHDGTQIRIICDEKYLGIDIDTSIEEAIIAFRKLIENYNPFWTTIMEERGLVKLETTIDLLYRDVFRLE